MSELSSGELKHCPECGAPWTSEEFCAERFYRFMALEMGNAEVGIVHHLTVAAYMLQHPNQLSQRGWQEMRTLLKQFVVDGVSPEMIRNQYRNKFDSQRRIWSLKKGQSLQLPPNFTWNLTIMSVDDSTPEQYCRGINQWARQVLLDVSPFEIVSAK